MLLDLFQTDDPRELFLIVFTRLTVVLLILPLHECAHGWSALKLGDDTAKMQGRLTLNPIAHLDPVGLFCMLLIGFGWAKPVPVTPLKFDRKHTMRGGMALTAAAGPLSNLLAAALMMIVFRVFSCFRAVIEAVIAFRLYSEMSALAGIHIFMQLFISINLGLAFFNLIPIPPLDGSKILAFFAGRKLEGWVHRNQQLVSVVFMFILITGALSKPLGAVSDATYSLLSSATDWIPELLGVL